MITIELLRLDGRFVGSLSDQELLIFNEACKSGLAYRSSEDHPGLLGCAKVRMIGEWK
jgi:hypothetical protein